jgi:hypothetical protein
VNFSRPRKLQGESGIMPQQLPLSRSFRVRFFNIKKPAAFSLEPNDGNLREFS